MDTIEVRMAVLCLTLQVYLTYKKTHLPRTLP